MVTFQIKKTSLDLRDNHVPSKVSVYKNSATELDSCEPTGKPGRARGGCVGSGPFRVIQDCHALHGVSDVPRLAPPIKGSTPSVCEN